MASQPLPDAEESRYSPYIEELHELFANSGIAFGSPQAMVAVTDRLQGPGTFADDLASLVRSIVLRQGGAMPHAQVLEILSFAIAGPDLANAPQQYREPLRQLLTFVSGVMRRPWNVPPSESAGVVPFQKELPMQAPEAEARQSTIADAVFKNRGETHPDEMPASFASADSKREQLPRASAPLPAGFNVHPTALRPSPLRRNLLIGAAATVALAAILVVVLRPHSTAEVFHVGPAPTPAATPLASPSKPSSHVATNPQPAFAGSRSRPEAASAKPSPYRDEQPLQANQRAQAATPAEANSAPISPAPVSPASAQSLSEQTPPQELPQSQPATARSSPRSFGSFRSRTVPRAPGSHITVSSGVMASYLIFAPDPRYPTVARIAHIQGQVILQAVVAKDGSVSSVRVLRGNRLLRGAAQDAVRRWRYRPYRLEGKPIDVATIITVDFHKHD